MAGDIERASDMLKYVRAALTVLSLDFIVLRHALCEFLIKMKLFHLQNAAKSRSRAKRPAHSWQAVDKQCLCPGISTDFKRAGHRYCGHTMLNFFLFIAAATFIKRPKENIFLSDALKRKQTLGLICKSCLLDAWRRLCLCLLCCFDCCFC